MDLYKQGMKGPTRPAPTIPGVIVNRYSPVTNWDDDPFGADVFEPTPHAQKKKPPPRPPPPRVGMKQPDVPAKPSHFIRRPTVLSSLLSRKPKQTVTQNIQPQQTLLTDFPEMDSIKMFPKCEPKNVQTGALIDLSSPPSSPTFTTRSSSDGLSVDSFGSDATTTSTNHHNHMNGNASQAESGFEDDFDLFLNTRKITREDTLESFTTVDPFSPPPSNNKPPLLKKPEIMRDTSISQPQTVTMKGPTIIRAKPARPKPPENSSLLKTTFGGTFPVSSMTINTTTPIQKIYSDFGDSFDKPLTWDESTRSSPEREPSPPMPSIPPPPPPIVDEDGTDDAADGPTAWPDSPLDDDDQPHAIALFDYFTDHPDDLCFTANTKIKLIRRVDDEWLSGSIMSGAEGLFPANYVEIKVPLPNEKVVSPSALGRAVALYDFEPDQPGDLKFLTGDTITIKCKLNDEWYFGECNGNKGQFPVNYVKMS